MRKNKFSFTDSRLERIKADGKRRCYYDTKCPGLEFRVSPSGYKVFSFVGLRGSRQRLGQFPPLTVKVAREVANEKRLCVELNVNPVQRESLGTLWEKYRDDLIARNCSSDTVIRFGRRFRHLEPWKNRRLDRIAPDMVLDLQRRLKKKGQLGLTNDVITLLRAMVNFATRRGWQGRSPVAGVPRIELKPRKRFIEPHELLGFISSLEEREDVFGDLILLALFTGVRRDEAQKASWADVNLDRRKWTFVGRKSKAVRTVYLSDYVLEIFRRRRRLSLPTARFVFENPFTEKPLTWVRRIMYRAEMVARGLPEDTEYLSVKNDFSMHTLRHSFITYGLRAGIPVQVLQSMVGHSRDRRVTVGVYGHSTVDWEREGFQKVADLIRKVAWEERPKPSEDESGRIFREDNPSESMSTVAVDATTAMRPATLPQSLEEQKAAYLRHFKAQAAERRPKQPKAIPETPRLKAGPQDSIAARAKRMAIMRMLAMWEEGKSISEIATDLNRAGMTISRTYVQKLIKEATRGRRPKQKPLTPPVQTYNNGKLPQRVNEEGVKEIVALRSAGRTLRQIAKEMTERGVTISFAGVIQVLRYVEARTTDSSTELQTSE